MSEKKRNSIIYTYIKRESIEINYSYFLVFCFFFVSSSSSGVVVVVIVTLCLLSSIVGCISALDVYTCSRCVVLHTCVSVQWQFNGGTDHICSSHRSTNDNIIIIDSTMSYWCVVWQYRMVSPNEWASFHVSHKVRRANKQNPHTHTHMHMHACTCKCMHVSVISGTWLCTVSPRRHRRRRSKCISFNLNVQVFLHFCFCFFSELLHIQIGRFCLFTLHSHNCWCCCFCCSSYACYYYHYLL